MKRKTEKIRNFLKNILFWLKNIFRIKEVRKKKERKDLRLLKRCLRKYLANNQPPPTKAALEEEIYRLIEKYLKLFKEQSTKTVWGFIEGIAISPKEDKVIREIWVKKDIKAP